AQRIRFDLRDNTVDLIDAHAVVAAPFAPLRSIHAAEVTVFVSPFIPNGDTVLVEIVNVCVAAQEPEQLVDDRFDVQLLGCEQRESRSVGTQIKARLAAEDRQRPGAGAIGARLTVLEHESEKIVVLPHAKKFIPPQSFRQSKNWRTELTCGFNDFSSQKFGTIEIAFARLPAGFSVQKIWRVALARTMARASLKLRCFRSLRDARLRRAADIILLARAR